MPNDITRTSIPNELAILTELMWGHHILKLDQFFIIFCFLFHFSFYFLFFSTFSLYYFPFFFTMNS